MEAARRWVEPPKPVLAVAELNPTRVVHVCTSALPRIGCGVISATRRQNEIATAGRAQRTEQPSRT